MEKLKLVSTSNTNDKAGKTRGTIRKRKGFKPFDNLPIQTKIRYLKQFIVGKNRRIKQKILWLKELKLRKKHGRECQDFDNFWKDFNKLSDNAHIVKQAAAIDTELKIETEERTNHIEALRIQKDEAKRNLKTKVSKKEYKKVLRIPSNSFQNVNKKLTSKINFWLSESNCKQMFNSTSIGDSYALFSNGSLENWKNNLEQLENEDSYFNILDDDQIEKFEAVLSEAKNDLKKLFHSFTRAQSLYRKETLLYFLESNSIDAFTRKVLPKARSAPAAHSTIWDPSINDFRNCVDESEQMKATSQYHGKWMGNSQAEEVCAYAEIVSKGKLGSRGIKLKPDRKVTKNDLKTLLPNHDKMPARIKKTFLDAHGEHTANLFKEPEIDHPELFYPFYLLSENGSMQEDEHFQKNFWKSLARIPSKARFEGFQMSVLGRFGRRWSNVLLDIIKLILITRYVPPELRQMARFPIPKPGKPNEYRPISLCNDIYCYINAIITSYSSLGIERAGILHDGMCAYRKGKGCASLVTMELSFREDCAEHNLPVLQLDEDEEKFFDRVPVEILLAAMRINGFPNQGFLEIKASSMQAKTVEIITSSGIAYARFVCGLEQGNPDSPTISNLVIKLKHDIWQIMSEEAKKILVKDGKINQGYTFQTLSEGNKMVHLCRIGYCDDNSKFCCVSNEEDLLFLATYYLQLSGDLSMVTKIGRKSSKCELQFFNVSAAFAIKMHQFWSTAWSYVEDGPVEEKVPFKINMKKEELKKLYDLINYSDLEEMEKARWDEIIHAKAHKHLGLRCSLNADTSTSCQETISNIHNRIIQLKLHNMHESAQIKSLNMLCVTMHSFVPLQMQYDCNDLMKLDRTVTDILRKRQGTTSSDSTHRFFLPKNKGGKGIISFLDQDLIAVTRELEIISNLMALDGDSFRTRIQAIRNYSQNLEDDDIVNHARFSILKLAKFGIHFRDRNDDIINNILSSLNKSTTFPSIGSSTYTNGNRSTINPGIHRNLDIAFGSKIWKTLKIWDFHGREWTKEVISFANEHNVDQKFLQKHTDGILKKRFDNITSMYSFWEWRNLNFSATNISDQQNDWKFNNMSKIIHKNFPSSYLSLTDIEIQQAARTHMEIKGWANSSSQPRNTYDFFHRLFDFISHSKSPIFISTDGGHELLSKNASTNNGSSTITTAAFVISVADIRPGETLQSGQWVHRPVIPMFSRASILPPKIGSTPSDIATGELWAFALSELSLPSFLPRIVTTDSKSTRDLVIKLRDMQNKNIDRSYIRSLVGGVSKFIFGTFQQKIWDAEIPSTASNFITQLQLRTKETCEIGSTWIQEETGEEDRKNLLEWEASYFDQHLTRPIWKVNSHQLNDAGTDIKNIPRYDKLIPNLSSLSTNHHADKSADFVKKFPFPNFNIDIANSELQYFMTWNGDSMDRHTSDILTDKFADERIKRLKTKATQGLLWRWYEDIEVSWELLESHKGWLRCLLGLSRSHTRCLYKDELYRNCCKEKMIHESDNTELLEKLSNSPSKQSMINLLSGCMWCGDLTASLGKGNRKHAFLSCQRVDLRNFRNEMRNLINDKLISFFQRLQQATSFNLAKKILHDVEEAFLKAQSSQLGRLKKVPNFRNNLYLPITDLLAKWEINDWRSFQFHNSCFILSEIFGLEPNPHTHTYSDEELGVIDAPWLGMVPKFLNSIIVSACTKLDGTCTHHETREATTKWLLDSWEELKELMMGKAIGLHRIIGTTGSEFEKTITKIFDKRKPEETEQEQATNNNALNSTQSPPCSKKRTCKEISDSYSTPPIIKKARTMHQQTSICIGVTCGKESVFWCADNDFSANRISKGTKQCTRCGRYMTAFKRVEACLDNMLQQPKNEKAIKKIIQFCITHESLQFKYISFMNMLDVFLPQTMQLNKALYTNKKTIPERHKLLCRILHKSILLSTRQNTLVLQVITSAKQSIQQLQQKKNKSFNNSITSDTIPPVTEATPNSPNESTSPIKLVLPEAIEANGNSWLSGMAVTKAVDVIRSWNRPNIFIGNGDSNITIQTWEPTHQWESFARIFGSENVMDRKPDGTYFIPVFSGSQRAGHWHLVVINKCRRSYLGWILDSLNTECEDTTIHRKIATAFCPGRYRLRWNTQACLPQIELECGIRVLSSIIDIINGLRNGDAIHSCVSSASLSHIQNDDYDSNILRQKIALLINIHQPNMITTLSRRRRQRLQNPSSRQHHIKRRKKLQKTSSSNIESIQIN